jgi:hypothetical protein
MAGPPELTFGKHRADPGARRIPVGFLQIILIAKMEGPN